MEPEEHPQARREQAGFDRVAHQKDGAERKRQSADPDHPVRAEAALEAVIARRAGRREPALPAARRMSRCAPPAVSTGCGAGMSSVAFCGSAGADDRLLPQIARSRAVGRCGSVASPPAPGRRSFQGRCRRQAVLRVRSASLSPPTHVASSALTRPRKPPTMNRSAISAIRDSFHGVGNCSGWTSEQWELSCRRERCPSGGMAL